MNDLIVNEVVHIPLVHRASVVAHRADLKNVEGSGWDSNVWNIPNWTIVGIITSVDTITVRHAGPGNMPGPVACIQFVGLRRSTLREQPRSATAGCV